MSLYSLCQWLQDTAWGTAIRESTLLFPIIETIHVLALSLSVGTVAIFDRACWVWDSGVSPSPA